MRSAQLFLTDVWSIFWQNKNLVFSSYFITKTLYFLVVFYKNVFLKLSDSITKQSYYRGRQVFTTKINNVQKSVKSPRLTSNFSFFWFLCLEVQPTSVSDVCVLRFLSSSFFRPNIPSAFGLPLTLLLFFFHVNFSSYYGLWNGVIIAWRFGNSWRFQCTNQTSIPNFPCSASDRSSNLSHVDPSLYRT